MVKGEIYPIPKNIQILRVKRLCLKYDPNYQLKLYLNGEFSDSKMIPVNDPKDIYSFRSDKILNTISKLTNIDRSNKKSGLFKIIKIFQKENYAEIQSIPESKKYKLELDHYQMNLGEFLWINCFGIQKEKIVVNKLTFFEKVDDQKFAEIVGSSILKDFLLFKVIDIDENYIMIIDSNEII